MNSNQDMASISGQSIDRANSKDAIHDEIDLLEALTAHMKCKIHLRDYLDGKIVDYQPNRANISRHDQCMLGKWIVGPGRAILGSDEQFSQLYADHQQLHKLAADMVSLAQSDEHVAAHEMFNGEFQKISHRVKQEIVKVSQNIEE